MGYPTINEEKEILRQHAAAAHLQPLERITPVMSGDDILDLQEEVKNVRVDEALVNYLMEIVTATRESEMLDLGVSPRASLALFRAAQALAFSEDRAYCIADDIKRLIVPVFGHRIVVNSRYTKRLRQGEDADLVLGEIVRNVKTPL
jgi:MoxR-like ATPase